MTSKELEILNAALKLLDEGFSVGELGYIFLKVREAHLLLRTIEKVKS